MPSYFLRRKRHPPANEQEQNMRLKETTGKKARPLGGESEHFINSKEESRAIFFRPMRHEHRQTL